MTDGGGGAPRRTSLRMRVVIAGQLGALTMSAVSLGLALPLANSVARDEVRRELVRDVALVAARPVLADRLIDRQRVDIDSRQFVRVRLGDVRSLPPGLLSADDLRDLGPGDVFVDTRTVDGEPTLVAAAPAGPLGAVVGYQSLATVDSVDQTVVRRLFLALMIGLVVSVAVAWYIGGRVARPVVALAGSARRLADGERGVAVPTSDVTEVASAAEALAALDAALAVSESRQREFLLSISHEIRTPLTALQGYAEALRDGAIDDPAEVSEVLLAQASRLEAFVSDLLSLARLEADDFSVEIQSVHLVSVLNDVAQAWQARADRAGATVRVDTAGLDPWVPSDPHRLRQLLDGLVENALRAVAHGGNVELLVSTQGDRVTAHVRDDGPGIAPDEVQRAFERGFLKERYVGRRDVGTGLGLSIAARLADRLGVHISATSRPGEGLTVSLAFPESPAVTSAG